MSISYPDNTLNRSAVMASGLTDSTTYFDVIGGGVDKRLSLTELKKTGVQVFNILQYGADPTGVANSSVAMQAANDACAAAGGGVVYAPAGIYLINSTVTFSNGVVLRGDRNYTPGTVFKSAITDGSAVFYVDNKSSFFASDFYIDSNTGGLINCIGMHLDNVCNYFCLERIRIRKCQVGMDVEGWISATHHVYIDYCGTGFIGRQLNGSRISVATEQCVDHIELIDCNSSTFWLLAEGNAATMETGIVLNGCNFVTLDAPYVEFNTGCTGLLSAMSIGETTQCKDITINGGSVYTADGASSAYAVTIDDCNTFKSHNFLVSTGASQGSRALYVSSSAKNIDYDGRLPFAFVNDASNSIGVPINLFANW